MVWIGKLKLKQLLRQQLELANLYSVSELRCIKVCRAHHHGEDQLLKVSSELRLQITD